MKFIRFHLLLPSYHLLKKSNFKFCTFFLNQNTFTRHVCRLDSFLKLLRPIQGSTPSTLRMLTSIYILCYMRQYHTLWYVNDIIKPPYFMSGIPKHVPNLYISGYYHMNPLNLIFHTIQFVVNPHYHFLHDSDRT